MSRLLLNNTKIICTMGPSSQSRKIIKDLLKAGMRGARLNFSHGNYKHHQLLIDNIRQASKDLNMPCAIMQDLQGSKMRTGILREPVEVSKGEEILLIYPPACAPPKDNFKIIPIQYNLSSKVQKGDTILIDDGLIELAASQVFRDYVKAQVKNSGVISSNKGVNVPGREMRAPVITAKDKEDLQFGLKANVDAVALSFVENAEDIAYLKRLINQRKRQNQTKPLIIAKIERRAGLKNIDEIIREADGIMVARGDLGLEIPAADVPVVQKEIINKCLVLYKPVIVATQMLDSMIRNPRPTRAEVSDVAGAVIDHADGLMLSGETAFGKYPVESCRTMADVISKIEKSPYDNIKEVPLEERASDEEALAHAAWSLALEIKARAILATTISGKTARMIARFRPEAPIIVTCQNESIQRQLLLSWGIVPFILPKLRSVDKLIKAAVGKAKKSRLIHKGDKVVIISGQPAGQKGTNLVKVHNV